jgi:hypothetical protein
LGAKSPWIAPYFPATRAVFAAPRNRITAMLFESPSVITIALLVALGGAPALRAQTPDSRSAAAPETTRLSPRIRSELLPMSTLSALKSHLIEPFLAEPLIVDENGLLDAPRLVATQEGRVLLTHGDRAYARGPALAPLLDEPAKKQKTYQVFRNATPLRDPVTDEVLGYEAQYLGRALLVRSEIPDEQIPATLDIVAARVEIRVGDRLLPEPERAFPSYRPHAPSDPIKARIVSIYGSAVKNAAQNQVVAINRGRRDGLESGHVLAILKDGLRLIDPTDAARPVIKLPDERNGLLMVFLVFEKLSYALILDITDGVKVGDQLVNP